MAERYEPGIQRIFYRAANFASGLIIRVSFVCPDLIKSVGIILDEVDIIEFPGLYCFEFDFQEGNYVAYFYEGINLKASQAYSIRKPFVGDIVNINHDTEKVIIERKSDSTFRK